MAQPKKKNNGNNLRPTREGLRPARSDEEVQSDMEKGWPPPWSVSFADMTTNLMCFFVLWYALTIMKLPAEFLKIKTEKENLNMDIEDTRDMLKVYDNLARGGFIVKEAGIKAEKAGEKLGEVIEEVEKSKEIVLGLKTFLDKNRLSDNVDLAIKANEIIVSPRDSLFFDKGRAVIKPENILLLKQIGFILKANPGAVKIEGYTDDTPILPYHRYAYSSNWELSAARAVSVARYLIDNEGIDPKRIMVAGYGPLKPVAPNSDPLNRAKNRRVEIHMVISETKPHPAGSNNKNKDDKA